MDRADDAPKRAQVRISQWSPELAKLTECVDRLGAIMQAVIATGGSKPPKIPPSPRPVTAMDRVRVDKRREAHIALTARVLPPKP